MGLTRTSVDGWAILDKSPDGRPLIVGFFLSKADAERAKEQLRKDHPGAILVVVRARRYTTTVGEERYDTWAIEPSGWSGQN